MTPPNSYSYAVIETDSDLATVTVEITLPDGTTDEATFSTRSFCTSEDASVDELAQALDSVVASYIFSTSPPPAPRPASLADLLTGTSRVVTL